MQSIKLLDNACQLFECEIGEILRMGGWRRIIVGSNVTEQMTELHSPRLTGPPAE